MVVTFETIALVLLVAGAIGALGLVVGFIRRVATGSWQMFGISLLVCVGGWALALVSFSAAVSLSD